MCVQCLARYDVPPWTRCPIYFMCLYVLFIYYSSTVYVIRLELKFLSSPRMRRPNPPNLAFMHPVWLRLHNDSGVTFCYDLLSRMLTRGPSRRIASARAGELRRYASSVIAAFSFPFSRRPNLPSPPSSLPPPLPVSPVACEALWGGQVRVGASVRAMRVHTARVPGRRHHEGLLPQLHPGGPDAFQLVRDRSARGPLLPA